MSNDRVYLEISGNVNDYQITANGNDLYAVETGNNIYCISYAVYAKELNEDVEILIKNAAGETVFTLTMTPLYYAKVMAANYKGDNEEAYKKLMNAIKLYSDAAIAYKPAT